MKLLVLGGTDFLGARFVEAALERGHSLTLFTRGRTKADRFGERVARLVGDRDPDVGAGLAELADAVRRERYDAVVDISGYVPRHVQASAALTAPGVDTYLYVSTVSVYADPPVQGSDESAPLIRLDDPTVEEITAATYGGLKVLCEERVRAAAGDKTLIVRPGILGGREDFTERLTFWPWLARATRGGRMLAPGDGSDLTSVLDARDLAQWMVELCERGATATRAATGRDVFNTAGEPVTFRELIAAARAAVQVCDAGGCDPDQGGAPLPEVVWLALDELERAKIEPWSDLPMFAPPARQGLFTVSSDAAVAAGLQRRPLVETCADALGAFTGEAPKAGLSLERAQAAVAARQA